MHFYVLILFFEILGHIWYIFGPDLLPGYHSHALIEEIQACFIAPPLVDRGFEQLENL